MEYAIEVKDLTKVYEEKIKALNGLNLNVESGKIFALLGPNGSGKTTLMRILTTQLIPTSGKAFVFGFDVVHDDSAVRKMMSYIPQEVSVWNDISGYENLSIYAKIYGIDSGKRGEIIKNVLDKMGLTEFKDNLVGTYSGGMTRRLEIASAMLVKPRILFLDEPTIGLDPSARKTVWETLESFKKEFGTTVFFNTHYMDEAEHYSDQIAIIDRGSIVKIGTVKMLEHSVSGDVIQLTLSDHLSENFLEKIKRLKGVNEVIVNDLEINIIVEDAETALPSLMDILKSKSAPIKRISITKPTLDDVFLKYAGTRLEPSGRIGEIKQVRSIIRRG